MASIERIDDGKDDMIFGFDMNGEKIAACTVHQEFLDKVGIPGVQRPLVAQAVSQMFIGMMKPFMELVDQNDGQE